MIGGLAQGWFESLILIVFALEALKVECREEVEHNSSCTVIQGVERSMEGVRKNIVWAGQGWPRLLSTYHTERQGIAAVTLYFRVCLC